MWNETTLVSRIYIIVVISHHITSSLITYFQVVDSRFNKSPPGQAPPPVPGAHGEHVQINGNGTPAAYNAAARHSMPSLHPAPQLNMAGGMQRFSTPQPQGHVSQTLPPGAKPPTEYDNKVASLDRSSKPPVMPPKHDKKRHSVLGIFKKSKKDKENK